MPFLPHISVPFLPHIKVSGVEVKVVIVCNDNLLFVPTCCLCMYRASVSRTRVVEVKVVIVCRVCGLGARFESRF